MRTPKYRILQVNNHFFVQKKFLWWWSDITIDCDDMAFPLDFPTREIAEEYIKRIGEVFHPVITAGGEYDKKGEAIR